MEKNAKRLRGHQLEIEKEKGHPLAKGDVQPSALADKLLCLWAHGSLSASAVQDIAHGAMLDGADHEELLALAKKWQLGYSQRLLSQRHNGIFLPKVDSL